MSRLGTRKREYKTESGRKRRAGSSARDDETGRRRRNETKTGRRLPAALARLDAGRHQSRAVPAGDLAMLGLPEFAPVCRGKPFVRWKTCELCGSGLID
jgi:hypothetical protein